MFDLRPNEPADNAGPQAGGVIVGFAGVEIASLRDYADGLIGAKIVSAR